ncbi:29401_t:CDS:1, partial [Racocetra persica]
KEINEGFTEEEILEIVKSKNKKKKKKKQKEDTIEEIKISYIKAKKYIN